MRFVSGWSTEHDPPELKEIKTLVERLHSGTRHEDKRDALKGLTALSERPELQQDLGLRAIPVAAAQLSFHKDDEEILLPTTDLLSNLMQKHELPVDQTEEKVSSLKPSTPPHEANMKLFLQEPSSVSSLLDILDMRHLNLRLSILHLLTLLLTDFQEKIQQLIITHPLGVNRIADILHDERDPIRAPALDLIRKLTRRNATIQGVIAYDGFTPLFHIIDEALASHETILIADALGIIENVLVENASNQKNFCESGYVAKLQSLITFDEAETVHQDNAIIAQVVGILGHIVDGSTDDKHTMALLGRGSGALDQGRPSCVVCLLQLSANTRLDAPVRQKCLAICATVVAGHETNQEFLFNECVDLPNIGLQGAIFYLLVLALEGSVNERWLAERVISAYFTENPDGQALAAETFKAVPPPVASADNDQVPDGDTEVRTLSFGGMIIDALLIYDNGFGDPMRFCAAIRIVSYILRDNKQTRSDLLVLNLADTVRELRPDFLLTRPQTPAIHYRDRRLSTLSQSSGGSGRGGGGGASQKVFLPRICMDALVLSSQSKGVDSRVQVVLLSLICVWFYDCPKAIRVICKTPKKYFPAIIDLASRGRDIHIRGLASFVITIILEFAPHLKLPPAALRYVPRGQSNGALLYDVIANQVGAKRFRENLEQFRSSREFLEAVGRPQSSEFSAEFQYYDRYFVTMFEKVSKTLDKRLLEIVMSSGLGDPSRAHSVAGSTGFPRRGLRTKMNHQDLELQALRNENKSLNETVKKLIAERSNHDRNARRGGDEMSSDVSVLRAELQRQRMQHDTDQLQIAQLTKRLQESRDATTRLTSDVSQLRAHQTQVTSSDEHLGQLKAELADARAELDMARQRYDDLASITRADDPAGESIQSRYALLLDEHRKLGDENKRMGEETRDLLVLVALQEDDLQSLTTQLQEAKDAAAAAQAQAQAQAAPRTPTKVDTATQETQTPPKPGALTQETQTEVVTTTSPEVERASMASQQSPRFAAPLQPQHSSPRPQPHASRPSPSHALASDEHVSSSLRSTPHQSDQEQQQQQQSTHSNVSHEELTKSHPPSGSIEWSGQQQQPPEEEVKEEVKEEVAAPAKKKTAQRPSIVNALPKLTDVNADFRATGALGALLTPAASASGGTPKALPLSSPAALDSHSQQPHTAVQHQFPSNQTRPVSSPDVHPSSSSSSGKVDTPGVTSLFDSHAFQNNNFEFDALLARGTNASPATGGANAASHFDALGMANPFNAPPPSSASSMSTLPATASDNAAQAAGGPPSGDSSSSALVREVSPRNNGLHSQHATSQQHLTAFTTPPADNMDKISPILPVRANDRPQPRTFSNSYESSSHTSSTAAAFDSANGASSAIAPANPSLSAHVSPEQTASTPTTQLGQSPLVAPDYTADQQNSVAQTAPLPSRVPSEAAGTGKANNEFLSTLFGSDPSPPKDTAKPGNGIFGRFGGGFSSFLNVVAPMDKAPSSRGGALAALASNLEQADKAPGDTPVPHMNGHNSALSNGSDPTAAHAHIPDTAGQPVEVYPPSHETQPPPAVSARQPVEVLPASSPFSRVNMMDMSTPRDSFSAGRTNLMAAMSSPTAQSGGGGFGQLAFGDSGVGVEVNFDSAAATDTSAPVEVMPASSLVADYSSPSAAVEVAPSPVSNGGGHQLNTADSYHGHGVHEQFQYGGGLPVELSNAYQKNAAASADPFARNGNGIGGHAYMQSAVDSATSAPSTTAAAPAGNGALPVIGDSYFGGGSSAFDDLS